MGRKLPEVVVERDGTGSWRWTLYSANSRVLCEGHGFDTKRNAVRGFDTAAEALRVVVDLDRLRIDD